MDMTNLSAINLIKNIFCNSLRNNLKNARSSNHDDDERFSSLNVRTAGEIKTRRK